MIIEKTEEINNDEEIIHTQNQTMTNNPKYLPKGYKNYKNPSCRKCIPCEMKLLYKYNFHTAAL